VKTPEWTTATKFPLRLAVTLLRDKSVFLRSAVVETRNFGSGGQRSIQFGHGRDRKISSSDYKRKIDIILIYSHAITNE
jgi:hypothetical protein